MTPSALTIWALFPLLAAGAGSEIGAPGTTFQDCPACPAMVVVPAGRFLMGAPADEPNRGDDEGPAHQVTFTGAFAIGRYEVTRGEFAAFVAATGHAMSDQCLVYNGVKLEAVAGNSWRDPSYTQTDDHPVVCVSWYDAAAYTNWLSKLTDKPYRLPSEAEWEYSARGGTQTAYPFPAEPDACDYGNVSDRSAQRDVPQWNKIDCDDGVGLGTASVGSYRANRYGLYDTMGNVWEWVADCYAPNYERAPTDGSALGTGSCDEVLDRGGGFSNVFPGHLRPANRSRAPSPSVAVYSLGFRVARSLP